MPDVGQSGVSREQDARRLHHAGYSRRAVWAKWVLDDFRTLYGHLTEGGQPIEDDGKLDSAFYLDFAEWREVAAAAQRIADLAVLVASARERGSDE